ncbi:MAG: hypothetical protein CSA62_08625 [Planctomycetota bacterium]|nr:MAG: hypothetical protein CSA62_08625 [Planctomycetota bacterium]
MLEIGIYDADALGIVVEYNSLNVPVAPVDFDAVDTAAFSELDRADVAASGNRVKIPLDCQGANIYVTSTYRAYIQLGCAIGPIASVDVQGVALSVVADVEAAVST